MNWRSSAVQEVKISSMYKQAAAYVCSAGLVAEVMVERSSSSEVAVGRLSLAEPPEPPVHLAFNLQALYRVP